MRSVDFTFNKPIQTYIAVKHRSTKLTMTKSKYKKGHAHPLLLKMMDYMGIEYTSLKIYGSRNLLNVIPAFWKVMDVVINLDQKTHSRGLLPIHCDSDYVDYLENVRDRRSTFGWY